MSDPISARMDGSNYLYSIAPDVCWTPMGFIDLPVAYNSICLLDSSQRTSRTVFNNSDQDFQLNTRCTKTTGHEPGTHRGVVVPGYLYVSHIMEASSSVFSEGWAVVRDGDPAWMNRPDEGGIEDRASSSSEDIEYL